MQPELRLFINHPAPVSLHLHHHHHYRHPYFTLEDPEFRGKSLLVSTVFLELRFLGRLHQAARSSARS